MGIIETLDKAAAESTARRHILRVMSPTEGDLKIVWDPDNADEVSAARKTFDDMTAKGMVAYRVSKKGEKTEAVKSFDKHAEAMILAPAPRGG